MCIGLLRMPVKSVVYEFCRLFMNFIGPLTLYPIAFMAVLRFNISWLLSSNHLFPFSMFEHNTSFLRLFSCSSSVVLSMNFVGKVSVQKSEYSFSLLSYTERR